MAKFVIECPYCGNYAEGKTGFFAKKRVDCSCGRTINIRVDKMTSRVCAHCGNSVVFDQTKGGRAVCPVCHEPINEMSDQSKVEEFSCMQCGVKLRSNKGTVKFICPVCDCENDVAERVMQEKIRKDGLASIIKYEGDADTLVWKHPGREPGCSGDTIKIRYGSAWRISSCCVRRAGYVWEISRELSMI